MTNAIPLPHSIIKEHKLVLTNDFSHEHRRCVFAKDGSFFIFSTLFYNYSRYGEEGDRGGFQTWIVSRYAQNGDLSWQADLREIYQLFARVKDKFFGLPDCLNPCFYLLNNGSVVISTEGNRALIFDSEMSSEIRRVMASDFTDEEAMKKENLVYDLARDLDGREVYLVGEPGIHLASWKPSLICISDQVLSDKESCHALKAVACTTASSALFSSPSQKSRPRFTYLSLESGEACGGPVRPSPGLAESQEKEIFRPHLEQIYRLDQDTILVPLFHGEMRGGIRQREFHLFLLSANGQIKTTLPGISPGEESPHVDHRYTFAVIHKLGAIVYSNKFALWIWDFQGELLLKMPLKDSELKALMPFQANSASSDGRLLFCHPKQHRFFLTDPVEATGDIPSAIARGLKAYKKGGKELKTEYQNIKNRWVSSQSVRRPRLN